MLASSPYLDYVAKPSKAAPIEQQRPEESCRQWASFATCDEGHMVAKTIFCTREWCPDCGQLDSEAHTRRWVRWLPKAQQLISMGYLVVTFPVPYRQRLRTKEQLTGVASRIKAVLIEFGFVRGLRRWHYFGECPVHPKRERDSDPCRCSRGYHPHLNFLLESGYISPARLEQLKQAIYKEMGFKLVIHYQFTDVPAKMVHLLKYVTRPTFLDRSWDNDLANNLYGHRTTQSWGFWKDSPIWTLEETEEEIPAPILAISRGVCPYCAKILTYSKKVGSVKILELRGYQDFGLGYYGKDELLPDLLEYQQLDRRGYT